MMKLFLKIKQLTICQSMEHFNIYWFFIKTIYCLYNTNALVKIVSVILLGNNQVPYQFFLALMKICSSKLFLEVKRYEKWRLIM